MVRSATVATLEDMLAFSQAPAGWSGHRELAQQVPHRAGAGHGVVRLRGKPPPASPIFRHHGWLAGEGAPHSESSSTSRPPHGLNRARTDG
jgi:hypothetical protein